MSGDHEASLSVWQAQCFPPNTTTGPVFDTAVLFLLYRQASLRYRELNDGLETVQEKLRDARVRRIFVRGEGMWKVVCPSSVL